MTVILHGALGFSISQQIWKNKFHQIIATILSMLPDVGRYLQSNRDDWTVFYNPAHNIYRVWWIPYWNLHAWLDYPLHLHTITGGVNRWYWYGEIIGWIVVIGLFLIQYGIPERKTNDSNRN